MDVKFVVLFVQDSENGDMVLWESEGFDHYPNGNEIAELGDIGVLWDYATVEKRYYPKRTVPQL